LKTKKRKMHTYPRVALWCVWFR